ncbi:MAG: TusE/DsrC/DsvC family sulfur relay protein [Gammaproteobacteria bacterium]|nr:TusE/DsrC/DsvC family sulfur relay protein [Gammaproteobacteria bacterium]
MYTVDAGLLAEDKQVAVLFDEDGFLMQPEIWSQGIAQYIADCNAIAMLPASHMKIVQFVRDYYFEVGGFVTPHRICSKLDIDKAEMKKFFGSCTTVWKIAGLPNPGEEARTYMN